MNLSGYRHHHHQHAPHAVQIRRNKLGGADTDGSTRIASAVLDMARALDALEPPPKQEAEPAPAPARPPKRRLEVDHSIRMQLEQANRLLVERAYCTRT